MTTRISVGAAEEVLAVVQPGQSAPALHNLYRDRVTDKCGAFSAQELLAVATARALRAARVPSDQATIALRLLWSMPTERMEADFQRGAHFLVVIGGRIVIPRLVERAAVERNEVARQAVELDPELRPVLVDVLALARRLRSALAERLGRG